MRKLRENYGSSHRLGNVTAEGDMPNAVSKSGRTTKILLAGPENVHFGTFRPYLRCED
ncbi:MAG: hypothetical protein IPN95_08345 [Bacteroidetes bacterium]|nr:hypothetical protein [Bacteroidota bacterium]